MQRRREDGWRHAAYIGIAVVVMFLLVSSFHSNDATLTHPHFKHRKSLTTPGLVHLCHTQKGSAAHPSSAIAAAAAAGVAGSFAGGDVASAAGTAAQIVSIGFLHTAITSLCGCTHSGASTACTLINRLYEVSWRQGRLNLPEPFKPRVKAWVGNNDVLFNEVPLQSITSVYNKFSHESTIYNPLRGKRPGANAGSDALEYIEKITAETAKSCDFCNYKDNTASDTFGRIESKHAITAANTFKYDAFHSLILFRRHHPTKWDLEEFLDFSNTAMRWFQKAYETDSTAVYPHLMWDLLPKASASQLHPHAQASLAPRNYYGFGQHLRDVAQDYNGKFHGSEYFSDFVHVHEALGLTFRLGTATAVAHITPKKEQEVFIIAPEPNEDFFRLLFHTLRAYIDHMELYSFSLGMFLPPMDKGITDGLPAIVRVIDRGVPTGTRSDISAMELFAQPNVNADPFDVIANLRRAYAKQGLMDA